MSQGSEPGHDDYGLPRVDVEIPDDARELDRDVQAYYRELRALRRHERSRRWAVPLQRSGILTPLVASCLLIAMLSGMVLTTFSANSYISGLTSGRPGFSGTGPRSNGSAAPTTSAPDRTLGIPPTNGATPSPQPPRTGALLPNRTITVAGKIVALRALTSVALAIIPTACRCALALRQVLVQAKTAGVPVFLIGPTGIHPSIANVLSTSRHGTTVVATDTKKVLTAAYQPVGLTVLLVDDKGVVTVASRLRPGFELIKQLAGLTHPAH